MFSQLIRETKSTNRTNLCAIIMSLLYLTYLIFQLRLFLWLIN